MSERAAVLITHSHPPAPTDAVAAAVAAAARGRLADRRHAGERAKHGDVAAGIERVDPLPDGPTSASCSAATARSSTRCATSPAPACRSSASTSAPSASSPRSSATSAEEGIRRAFAGEIEAIDLPGLEIEVDGERAGRPQRRRLHPPPPGPGRRAQLQDRRRGGRPRPLRRPRRRDARSARPATTSPTRGRSWPGG